MTMMGSYDSPTFLGQKDKYLMGLSLPQIMVAMGVAAWWFFVSLTLPYSMITRITDHGPADRRQPHVALRPDLRAHGPGVRPAIGEEPLQQAQL